LNKAIYQCVQHISEQSDLSNPARYLSYTGNGRRPPLVDDSASKRFEEVTTSAIVGMAGAILEKASKLTVLSTSTYKQGEMKLCIRGILLQNQNVSPKIVVQKLGPFCMTHKLCSGSQQNKESTLTVSWPEEEGTSQANIISNVKRRRLLSARYPATCETCASALKQQYSKKFLA
jgi:hypothetical protein